MRESYWRHFPLKDIDPTSDVNLLPVSSMYMGTKIAICLTTQEYRQRAPDVQYFLKRVQEFYIEAACQIRKRFPIEDPVIKMLQVLNPTVCQSKFPSLVPLATKFPNIVQESELQQLDNEWRKLCLGSSGPLPFDSEEMGPEEFWARLGMITDGTGAHQFNNLCEFMHALLCLLHANVDVERIFSSVTAIKTKKRNKLHTRTVRALLKVKESMRSGSCVNFQPPPGVKEDVC